MDGMAGARGSMMSADGCADPALSANAPEALVEPNECLVTEFAELRLCLATAPFVNQTGTELRNTFTGVPVIDGVDQKAKATIVSVAQLNGTNVSTKYTQNGASYTTTEKVEKVQQACAKQVTISLAI